MRLEALSFALLVLFASCAVSTASAQEAAPSAEPASLSLDAATRAEIGYHAQRRTGIALMATGLAAHLAGAGSATFAFAFLSFRSLGGGVEDDRTWGTTMLVGGIAVSAASRLGFVFGVVLDVAARVRHGRAHEPAVSLTPDGFALRF